MEIVLKPETDDDGCRGLDHVSCSHPGSEVCRSESARESLRALCMRRACEQVL